MRDSQRILVLSVAAGLAALPAAGFAAARKGSVPPVPAPGPAPAAKAAKKQDKALFLAMNRRDIDEVRRLLASGVDPNIRDTIGMSALQSAAMIGDREILRALLEHGAKIDDGGIYGTALTMALMNSRLDAARFLLDRGASVAAQRLDGITNLMYAARMGDAELVRTLLAKKAPVDARDNNGSTALSYAARHGNAAAAEALLKAGAAADAADADGWTPLMHAAANGHVEAARALLKAGADPNRAERGGRTALILSTAHGDHPDVTGALISARAKLDAKDARGDTAADLAVQRGFTAAAAVLAQHGGLPTRPAPALPTARAAAVVGLERIEAGVRTFIKRTGCSSCHHEGIARFTTGYARAHGYRIDEALAQAQQKRVIADWELQRPLFERALADPAEIKNVPIMDLGDFPPTAGTLLLGHSGHAVATSPALSGGAMVLARIQEPSGEWRFVLERGSAQSTPATFTAQAIRALKTYAPREHAAEITERVDRARKWLAANREESAEARAWALLGLHWSGAPEADTRGAQDRLLSAQRADGGWAQEPGLRTDAYATGLALFALRETGAASADDPAVRRGVQYLLRTREADGTWYVPKRAMPANNYFHADFPGGQSQYASHMATCWAVLALIRAER